MRRYIKLHVPILTNLKVAALSSDAARWHYTRALVCAKQTFPEGRWLSLDYMAADVGPETFAFVPEFLAVGLLGEDGDGTIRVPQWSRGAGWQRSDKEAHKQVELPESVREENRANWRRRKAAERARRRAQVSRVSHPTDSGHVTVKGTQNVTPDVTDVTVKREIPKGISSGHADKKMSASPPSGFAPDLQGSVAAPSDVDAVGVAVRLLQGYWGGRQVSPKQVGLLSATANRHRKCDWTVLDPIRVVINAETVETDPITELKSWDEDCISRNHVS